ncbi:MAG: CDP-alcohol phosphatidyltransferase [Eggerthellaceae bacterium]
MGRQSDEALELASVDELIAYLMGAHSAYMQWAELTYYLTDANDIYWRAQDTNELNEKDHFVDCSELIASVREFIDLPFMEGGRSIRDVFPEATFYASVKIEGQGTPVPVV